MRGVALLLLLLTGHAFASEPLVLSVRVNGTDKATVIFERDGNTISAAPDAWASLGLELQPGELAKEQITAQELGIEYKLDEETQAIELDVPAERLPVQSVDGDRLSMPELAPAATGVLLNYSLAGNKTGSNLALSAGHEVRVAGRWGSVSTTGQANYTTHEGASYQRGQTKWRYDDYGRLISYEVGDVIAGGMQAGGFRIAKDPAALDPYTPIYPVPVLGGIAVDAGTARILSNGLPIDDRPVERGAFTLERPLASGLNNTVIILKDRFGREQRITRQLYVSRDVLKKGSTTWEVAAGAQRENQDYGQIVAYGRYSRGMTDRWTMTGVAELTKDARNASVEARIVLPRGVVDVRASGSTSAQGSGTQFGVGYTYQGPVAGVSVQHLRASDDYWQLAGGVKNQTSASLNLGRAGSPIQARVSYLDLDGQAFAEAGASYQRGNHNLQLGVRRDFQRRETSLEAGYRYTFGNGGAYASARQSPGQQALRVGAEYSGAVKDSYYRVVATQDRFNDSTRSSVRGSLDMQQGYATAEVTNQDGQLSVSATYEGAVHIGGSGVQRLKSVSDGYVVVRVPGVVGVPVQVNNRTIGKTNAKGEIVVGGLPSLATTKVSLDQRELPIGVSIQEPELMIAPRRQTGALAEFEVLGLNALTFTIQRDTPIKPGALAKSGEVEAQIGFDGQLFLEDPAPGQAFAVSDEVGSCQFTLPTPLPNADADTVLLCQ